MRVPSTVNSVLGLNLPSLSRIKLPVLQLSPHVSYHTRAISMNIVRATAWTLHDAAQKAKGRLCGKRAGSPAALG